MSTSDYGWSTWAPEILEAGRAARSGPIFNEVARQAWVTEQVAKARASSPGWVLWLILPALLFPGRWILAGVIIAIWALLKARAARRAKALNESLHAETARLRAEVAAQNREFKDQVLGRAEVGDASAAATLLQIWMEQRPEEVGGFGVSLREGPLGAWLIGGMAHPRASIPDRIPRIGSRGRTVHDRRKAADVNEDLTELNAAATLSVLLALLGKEPRRVRLIVRLVPDEGGQPVDWVALNGEVAAADVERAYRASEVPSAAIAALGGSVGRIQSKRIRPAAAPTHTSSEELRTSLPMSSPTNQQDAYAQRAATVWAEDAPAPSTDRRIPSPPADFTITVSYGSSYGRGGFLKAAKENAGKQGPADAPFVPFMTYWPTYSAMNHDQLRYYFRWRDAFRKGEILQADLSYLFVHVYELLHQVGVPDPARAAAELERLWTAYRDPFPKLDRYLVGWIADFYALHGSQDQVLAWYARALKAGVDVPDRELVADVYWAPGNYEDMPYVVVATLAGGNLGGNKFYREHNQDSWIDTGYRQALLVGDQAYRQAHGKSVREATLAQDGTRTISREPFASAVYELPKKAILLGRVPAITEGGMAATTFGNVVRFAENLMRAERGVTAKLRGITLDPPIAQYVEEQFGLYLRRSRPKPKVSIDLGRAQQLARESAEVRRILLDGTGVTAATNARSDEVARAGDSLSPEPARPSEAPEGLLTDLASVGKALGYLSPPCMAVVRAIADAGWEVEEDSAVLRAAAQGALVGPLIDTINEIARAAMGDVLIVPEGGLLVLQDDYRDEVHYILRGSLSGFSPAPADSGHVQSASAALPVLEEDSNGFGPAEIAALAILLAGGQDVPARLVEVAASVGSTPLILLDQLNETALAGPHGDLVVDAGSSPPALLEDAEPYVRELLTRMDAGVRPPHTMSINRTHGEGG